MDAEHIDPVRRRLREGAAQKPPDKMTREERMEWRALKTAQRAFQKQYCPSCVRWNLRKGGFAATGHPNDPADCISHWTDIMGTCWNYKPRPIHWYDAIAAYCATRREWRWRALGALARCFGGIMHRVCRRNEPR
ncbi:MAG: hypothetical protein HYW56_02170 [Candidatus Harrisonbacteria bacterium]|nr:hypothetical protein [Candidatus Harrisonbacteria bacterium]MBI2604327.1 hypothetical protein [Candidatus Harrisonbacteria bacterium]